MTVDKDEHLWLYEEGKEDDAEEDLGEAAERARCNPKIKELGGIMVEVGRKMLGTRPTC